MFSTVRTLGGVSIRDILFENCDFCGMEASGVLLGGLKEEPTAAKTPRYGVLRFINGSFDVKYANRVIVE